MTTEAISTSSLDIANETGQSGGGRLGSHWRLILRNVMRQRSRNLLLGLLILFASFVIVYFSQFLAGVNRNFSKNLVAIATGDVYIASKVTREVDRNVMDRDYHYFHFTPEIEAELRKFQGFVSVNTRLEFDTKVATEIDGVPFKAMSFDPQSDRALAANFRMIEGRMFNKGAYEIIVPIDFARRNQIKVGDSIRLVAKSVDKKVNLIDYRVTGLFSAISLPAWFDNYVYIDLGVARVLVDEPTAATRLNIQLETDNVSPQAVEELTKRVNVLRSPADPELEASDWRSGAQIFADLTGALQLSYLIATTIVVIMIGASLAFSTMMNIMERTKEIATLGALGATPRSIHLMLLGESLVLAGAASVAGIACATAVFLLTAEFGIPIANKELGGFLGSSHFYPAFDATGYVTGLLVPLFVALSASYFFALRASRLPIPEALADR